MLFSLCAKYDMPKDAGLDWYSFNHISVAMQQSSFSCTLPPILWPKPQNSKRKFEEDWLPSPTPPPPTYPPPHYMRSPCALQFALPEGFNQAPSQPWQGFPPNNLPPFNPQPKSKGNRNYMPNPNVNPLWRMDNAEKFRRCFPASDRENHPAFNDKVKCCARWAMRGFCFVNCKDSESHCTWDNRVTSAWDRFQATCLTRA